MSDFFNLVEKKTGRLKSIEIGRADNSQIYFWLQKVTLTKEKIKVTSSGSIAAGVWLETLPRTMEFDIAEILG